MDVLIFRDTLSEHDLRLFLGSCFSSLELIISDETRTELKAILDKAMKENGEGNA